ncbi:DUF4892 domain-containing protein [Marinobacter sp. S0848L]|uniref:DUF4892 domain-containing protein n=1 Tax=Marinobacter sp. S0848L TaxID=2926423 RepID=UPI001FF449DB|nr:DUF4892 domain-containing protein [Marinobacter sp. S0848L]MCK0105543.1 DUF4892 domain-containing protein [Marinobacter sp. S0848L]
MCESVRFRCLQSLVAVVLLGLSWAAAADSFREAPEAFPQSRLQLTKPIESSGHLVLFSPTREVRNEIRSKVMARLPVRGEGLLYEISRDASRHDARNHYLKRLQARGAQVLFECSGINCGRSNVWANQVFEQPKLLGRDTEQDYFVVAALDEQGRQWLTSVYTVTRGNLREYVWVEHLNVTGGAVIPGFEAGNGRVQGPVIVPWQGGITYRFDFTSGDRRQLLAWSEQAETEVVLVAFSELANEESFEDSVERSRQAADSFADLLSKIGVSRSQIQIIPAGSAVQAIAPERSGNRIEVVVIKRP